MADEKKPSILLVEDEQNLHDYERFRENAAQQANVFGPEAFF